MVPKHKHMEIRARFLGAALAALLLAGAPAAANMYDVVFAAYLPPVNCTQGCIAWTDVAKLQDPTLTQAAVDSWWTNTTEQALAGSSCAVPGAATGPGGAGFNVETRSGPDVQIYSSYGGGSIVFLFLLDSLSLARARALSLSVQAPV